MTDHKNITFMSPFMTRSATMTREAQLEAENRMLRERIDELGEHPVIRGVILELIDGAATIAMGNGQIIERSLKNWASKDARPGTGVRLAANGLHILSLNSTPPGQGQVVTVLRVHERVVEFQNQHMTVTAARGIDPVEVGDRVVLDRTGEIVVKNLGGGGAARTFAKATRVTWDDIGGLDEAKRILREALVESAERADLYRRFGQRPVKGIALFGPPGCGKTMLAKAAATALATVRGAAASASGFIYGKGPDLLDKFVGSSEANVRALFASARAHSKAHGYPALIYLDEADALLGRRGKSLWDGMEKTIVPQFLAEMDGLEETGAIVLLSTNRPDTLDPAIMRDERIDRKIEIRRPGREDSKAILLKHLRGRPLGVPAEVLAEAVVEALFGPQHVLVMVRCKDGIGDKRFQLSDLTSGAMLGGVVQRGTQIAIRRAIAAEDDDGKIEIADLMLGLAETAREERAINHDEDLAAFTDGYRQSVVRFDPVGR